MATRQMTEVIRHLRRMVLLRDEAGLTDGQLLEDYLSRDNEAALAALVQRHGPMVWGVCRRVLCNYHDAEDAFQATFLVLVRKAASITSRELLASWLYGVAHQTALKARATAAKRRARERQVTEMPEPAVTEEEVWRDLQPLLDEELSRLPGKYRVVIVLCDLEGKTRKEVAQQLGCPEGTVAGRLARARVRLAKRLAQRGVAFSGGMLAAVLSQKGASAGVPTSVVSSTIKAAGRFAAGQAAATSVISVKVAALTEGVLKAMFLHKIKGVMAVLVVMAAVGMGVSGLLQRTEAQAPPPESPKANLPRQDEGNLKETVLALQKRIWEANAKQDVTAMKNLLADDFAGLDKNGGPFDKGDELLYLSRWCEFDHDIKEARVVLLNDSSAIVIYEVHYKYRRSGSKDVLGNESRQGTGAWAKRNGQWWYIYKESHAVSAEKQKNLSIEMRWPQLKAIDFKGTLEIVEPQAVEANLKRQLKANAEEIHLALLKGDVAKFVDHAHPEWVKKEGGREKMIATLKAVADDLKAKGFAFQALKVEEPKEVLADGTKRFAVVPYIVQLKGMGGMVTQEAFVIGISGDQGKNWTFFSGDPAKIKTLLPRLLPEALKLPESRQPVFEKDS